MDLGRAVLFPGQRAELPPCHQCREHFAAQISLPRFFLCFREFEKELSYRSVKFSSMARGIGWCCVLAVVALLWQRETLAALSESGQTPLPLEARLQQLHVELLLEDVALLVAVVFGVLALYFLGRGCTRCRPQSFLGILRDELMGAGALILLIACASFLDPVGRSVVPEQEDHGLARSHKFASVALALTQLLVLLVVAAVPLRLSILAMVLLSTVPLSILLDEDGFGCQLIGIALPFIYLSSRSREITSRQEFNYSCQCQEMAMHLQEKEIEAKSNMTLARGMQSLAGRRSDMVLILTSNLEVWCSTALQDLFFQQEMDGRSFLDVLPLHQHELFLSAVSRVKEHKSAESLPVTLTRGYAKIILEYAGSEEARYVMSILLDEAEDEAFRYDQCAPLRISSARGYDPSRNPDSEGASSSRQRASFSKATDSEDDSLCYSASLVKCMDEIDRNSDATTRFRRLEPDERSIKAKCRDSEVQVNLVSLDLASQATQTDLHFLEDEPICSMCMRGRPPRPKKDALHPVPKQRSRSRCSSRSDSSDGSAAEGGRRTKRLVPASGSLRVTTPCWPETRPACVSTSVMWLCKHWNFSYLSVQCCPFHAALGVAFETLKTQKKDPCNPLWSPFTGWQCDFCTAMNHRNSEQCDLCGSGRTPGAGDYSGDLSTMRDHSSEPSMSEDLVIER
ncbi:unnamed protein product [Symbiodinium natans]|uniref:RanBP2-type domain-containing protein n=1 Tax=Symbiodinium natans TaxID=878477 RepID=A0A812M7K5_9DINO|nr:unnamed protein product [Symbiodinium natans]